MENQPHETEIPEIANGLHSIAIHLLRGLQDVDARSGLSRARLSALSVIVFAGPLRVSRLARIEGVKPPTMTLLIRGLEEEGLARRESDPTDARASLVSATAEGQRVLRESRARRLEAIEEKLNSLSAPERSTVARAASILARVYVPRGLPPLPGDSTSPVILSTRKSPPQPEGFREKPHEGSTQ